MLDFQAYPTVASGVLLVVGLYYFGRYRASLPLPPGPPRIPLLGNILNIPKSFEHVIYAEWGKKYGDVVYATAFGRHIVILNSVKVANDLLDQRSAIYSDRPYLPMLEDKSMMDGMWAFSLQHYSKRWQRHRRLFTKHINPTSVRTVFSSILTLSIYRFLGAVMADPDNLREHIMHTSASIILGVAYGRDVLPKGDPIVKMAEETATNITDGFRPKYLVNILPILRHVPSWFPGGGFKKFARETAELAQKSISEPFEWTIQCIAAGTARPSFLQKALQEARDGNTDPNLVQDAKEVAAQMYGAATDTSAVTLHALILQLILNPDIQRRAQAELDAVIGSPSSSVFRLPSYDDRESLPYIDALAKESVRWHPAAPTGVPHATVEEDVYKGWHIPKGAIVVANAWGMLRDERVYKDPYSFRPERFLDQPGNPAESDPSVNGVFGFGRRVCPGRALAENTIWLACACLLACFTFNLPKDENDAEINLAYALKPLPGFVLHLPSYPCTISPRSEIVERVIQDSDLFTA